MAHAVDAKIIVLDGDNLKLLGQFTNGFFGLMAVSPDGATIYSAATFFARGDHGTRSDVVELYDAATLALRGEIALSGHRAQTTAYGPYLQSSAGGALLFVQGATPASSVLVADVARRTLVADIPTAGCIGIFPSPVMQGRFSTLCGDGAAVTIDIDSDGHEIARRRSAKLFDPVDDALFIDGVSTWDKTIFVSFMGNVHAIDFSGPVATQDAVWPLVAGEDKAAGWRPGGYQIAAYNKATGQLYVLMHEHGYEGSHKAASDAIWRVDVARHAVVARATAKGYVVLAVTQDTASKLFGLSFDTGTLTSFNGETLASLASTPPGGVIEGGTLMVLH
jgi:methylamine dehydrogenase heavy chain